MKTMQSSSGLSFFSIVSVFFRLLETQLFLNLKKIFILSLLIPVNKLDRLSFNLLIKILKKVVRHVSYLRGFVIVLDVYRYHTVHTYIHTLRKGSVQPYAFE